MAIVKLSKSERRKISLFFVCLVAATICWFVFALSNPYIYTVKAPISYFNQPVNKLFHPLQPDTINLRLRGEGWKFLFSKFNTQFPEIAIDVSDLEHQDEVSLTKQVGLLNKQLNREEQIVSVSPQVLHFDFAKRASKKVPVLLPYSLHFKKQFHISGPLSHIPKFVTVTGPEEEIRKVKVWKTDSLILNNLDKSFSATVNLKPSTSSELRVLPQDISVTIPVDEFTEKVIEVPVEVINENGYHAKLLPYKVEVTLMVPLQSFQRVDKESVEAMVDLTDGLQKRYPRLAVKIKSVPRYCKVVRVEPQTLDYIVE